ncbi:ubiquitin-like protein Pup [Rarobacter incanus]|uniref:Prokaryotic ubiquitin-like protein Pup n=1 Tax=Rarobacter incanus TaxID=153494 RepID=A0A542SLX2_9MICO|nr:ubiquitin-like protein Pup [Rarobacter incanus]TQK75634.1 ubiquitin-like protein Pup [Rarobacter incanus]
MAQERINRPGPRPDDEPGVAVPSATVRDNAVDDLLDEIDDVLESNAEAFVKGFVQKGGQ